MNLGIYIMASEPISAEIFPLSLCVYMCIPLPLIVFTVQSHEQKYGPGPHICAFSALNDINQEINDDEIFIIQSSFRKRTEFTSTVVNTDYAMFIFRSHILKIFYEEYPNYSCQKP
jgi:hypothetical protein